MAFGNSPQMQWQQQLMQQPHPMQNAAQDQWFASGIGSSPQTWNGASTPGYGHFQQQHPLAHTPLQHPQLQDQFNAAANQSPMANWNGTQIGSSPVQMPPPNWWQSPNAVRNAHPQTAFIDPNGFHHYQHNGSIGQAQNGIGQAQAAGVQMQSPSQNSISAAMQQNFAQTPQFPRGAPHADLWMGSPPTQKPAEYDARDALRSIIGDTAAGGSGQPDSASRHGADSQSGTAGANVAPGGPAPGPPQQPTPEESIAAVFRMMAETQAAQLELARETNRALSEMSHGRNNHGEKERIPKILDTTFTAQEIEKCQFTMAVAKWDQEAHEFETYIQNKDAEHIVPAMCMTAQQWIHATHPDNPSAPALIAADKYVARQLHLCLRQELPRVQNFRKEMEMQMNPQQRASGRCVLAAMFVFQRPKTTSDMDELKQRYATTTFLTTGMSKDAALRGMHECVEAFEANPTRDKTRFAVHNAILAKLPSMPPNKAQTEEARLAMEALRFETMTYQKLITSCELDPSTNASSLNLEMFKATLAHALAKVPAQERLVSNRPRWARRDAFDASTCTDPGCAGCGCNECDCDDDECCESGRPEADAADGVTRTCWDCGGKIPDDHPMRKCNKKCSECGFSYCPRNGDPKKECVITSKKTITESSIIHNKADPPMALRGRALRSLISGQEEWRKKQAARHAAAASEAAINQFAASLGVSAASVQPDVSEADRRDQEAMLGGVLETAPPEEKTYELINPPPAMPPCDKPPGKLQADASTTSTMNGVKGVWQWAMLDSGANCTVSVVGNAQRYADAGSYKNIKASIGSQGKGQSTMCTGKCKLTLTFETGKQLPPIEAHDSPSSRKCLIDQNSLWYNHRIKVNLDTRKLEFKDGTTVDLHHRGDNRLWVRTFMAITDDTVACAQNTVETTFDDAKMLGLDANSADACTDIFELDANPASVLTCATLLLAAARLGCSAQGLQNVSKCVENFPAVNPDVETRRLIDADVHRRASIQKRAAAPQANPDRTDRPGHTQCFDGYGPMAFSGWADNGASAPRTPRQICNDTCPPPSPPPSPPAAYDTSDESYEEGSVMSVDGEIEEMPDDEATAGRSASAPTPQQMGLLNFTERVALGYIARRKSEPSLRALCFSDSGRHGRPKIEVGWQYSKRIQWRLQWAGIGQGTKIQDAKHEVWTHKIRVDSLEQHAIDLDAFIHNTDVHRDRRNNAAEKLADIQPRLEAHREQLAEARAKLVVMMRNQNVMALIAEMLRGHQRAHEHLCHTEMTSKWTR